MPNDYARRTLLPELVRCGLAVVLVAAALGLTLLLQGLVSTAGFIFFYLAAVASAWFGGQWAGWVAVILTTLAVDYVFIPPYHSFALNRESAPIFVEFAASSLFVGWFASWRKQAEAELQGARDELQMRVEERTADLKQSNARLVEEMAERKRAQDAYYEAQAELERVTRMSTMGALAASISHEVNQPLAAVVTNADACMLWLASNPPNVEEVRSAVDRIAQEGTRASDIVRRIRAMFSKAAPERARVQLNDLVREVGALMQVQAARSQVTLGVEPGDGLPVVMGDRVQLQQVIVNLVLNGIESTSGIMDRERKVTLRSQRNDSGHLMIAVKDTGSGIDPSNQKKMFDAFFTTKSQGMGMGLSICQSIIEAHGGRLWASANDDHGATFQFTLPAEREAA